MTHKPWFALLMAGLLAGLALMLAAAPALAVGTIIYVDKDATSGANNGSSWTDAYTKLQSALDTTNANGGTSHEIWVAEGTYYPDEGGAHVNNAVTETFVISYNNVQLYGGFAATETLRAQRDWTAHPTLLSGDIDANDWNTDTNHIAETWNDIVGNNAYHVLYLDGETNQPITATTTLDGLIITAGHANGSSPNDSGGGVYCAGYGTGKACSPTLTNVTFSGNLVNNGGGGMVNDGYNGGASSPTLTNVTFSGNSAGGRGGGMYNNGTYDGVSRPTLTNVTFSGNSAQYGGGMYNEGAFGDSSPTLANVTFSGNTAVVGGGMYNKGFSGASSPTLANVTFSDNSASDSGGGMVNYGYNSGASSPTLTNVTFSGNSASDSGGGMYNEGLSGTSSPTLTNVTFSGNEASACGGGMFNGARYSGVSNPTLTNVTFSGNSANYGGGMCNDGYEGASSPMLVNTILWGNIAIGGGNQISNTGSVTLTISYSDIDEDGYTGSNGNIRQNPQFVAPITATAAPTTTGNYRLNFGSPAIEVGNNLSVTVGTDLDGLPRLNDGNGDTTATVDLGAYEAGSMTCGVGVGTYSFPNQSGVSIQITTLGSELGCLYVDEMETNHAFATSGSGTQTGRYWSIRGLQGDKATDASGFTAVLTLPHNLAAYTDAAVCKYPGNLGGYDWDCAQTGSDVTTVWRDGITSFSDWAVGNNIGPTAVTLRDLTATANTSPGIIGAMGAALVSLAALWIGRRRLKTR